MSLALSERPLEERRTRLTVVGNDFTQRKGSGIHGDHTLAPHLERIGFAALEQTQMYGLATI